MVGVHILAGPETLVLPIVDPLLFKDFQTKMECSIRIQGPYFVVVASDPASGRSVIRMKDGKTKFSFQFSFSS